MPVTVPQIVRELRALGVEPGMHLIAHVSLRSMGWVCGGAVALIQALQEAVTDAGTIMFPAQTSVLSEPSKWCNPPVPESWWPVIREHMPPFDPRSTPTGGVGQVPECFRSFPGVWRSNHPAVSFCAWGALAEHLTHDHPLDFPFGEGSPLAKLHAADGRVLFIGVDYNVCTALHLAEERATGLPVSEQGAPVFDGEGKRRWIAYEQVDYNDDPFVQIGTAFEMLHSIRRGFIGTADSRLVAMRPLVDFAAGWLSRGADRT